MGWKAGSTTTGRTGRGYQRTTSAEAMDGIAIIRSPKRAAIVVVLSFIVVSPELNTVVSAGGYEG